MRDTGQQCGLKNLASRVRFKQNFKPAVKIINHGDKITRHTD